MQFSRNSKIFLFVYNIVIKVAMSFQHHRYIKILRFMILFVKRRQPSSVKKSIYRLYLYFCFSFHCWKVDILTKTLLSQPLTYSRVSSIFSRILNLVNWNGRLLNWYSPNSTILTFFYQSDSS